MNILYILFGLKLSRDIWVDFTHWVRLNQWAVPETRFCTLHACSILAWILQFTFRNNNNDMENRMFITTNDCQRLTGLVEFVSLKVKMPEIATRLYN